MASLFTAFVGHKITRNAAQPLAEVRPRFELIQATVGHDERFLRQIIHPRFIHAQRPNERAHTCLMLPHAGFEILSGRTVECRRFFHVHIIMSRGSRV